MIRFLKKKIWPFYITLLYKFSYLPKFRNSDVKKVDLGASNISFENDWLLTDFVVLDITKDVSWDSNFRQKSLIDNLMGEHVWEHLSKEDGLLAMQNCYNYLKTNGRLRIAVPDGYFPDQDYINNVKVNGIGPGAHDHKILYNYEILQELLESVGFKVELLEYWDKNGEFNFIDWENNSGKINRSSRYDRRNSTGKLNYTSLIVDAIKV